MDNQQARTSSQTTSQSLNPNAKFTFSGVDPLSLSIKAAQVKNVFSKK